MYNSILISEGLFLKIESLFVLKDYFVKDSGKWR